MTSLYIYIYIGEEMKDYKFERIEHLSRRNEKVYNLVTTIIIIIIDLID